MQLKTFYADLHIHIGRDIENKPVKITGSRTLTLTNILIEASRNKGIDMVGIIDCHVPSVQREMEGLIDQGKAFELEDGGIQFEQVTLILGVEIEVYDQSCLGPIHVLCFLPNLTSMKQFSNWLSSRMTNINLSSQRYYGTAKELQYKVKELAGLFIPAHVFTPFKSLYGKGVYQSLTEVLDPDLIDAVELGLSADTSMADDIGELHRYTFLTNSDAHSLAKIAREYQQIKMKAASFKELELALHGIDNREIVVNYGMNPLLGKYHQTVCKDCIQPVNEVGACASCGSSKVIKGVADRIKEINQRQKQHYKKRMRPSYIYQVPLEYIPKLGPKALQKLLDHFGTEMQVIHHASYSDLRKVIQPSIAEAIIQLREGILPVTAGGGGKYGKVEKR
ncbi:endonuclease Q family protein [Aquibacillus koreensis]|uniref:Endonuclease Q family protein n=1 Tax=Aquibacillus koreensis TaxID=279446 RepID=A0A9X4AGF8_9BACI|nr:endonuclease Q family protein [Aquibacillus koreensis]MCT2537455.1 endonuclease Q family protein [Aquibacillus koreensis]MDC3418901.1 endonuclease Q family protein [Aquibacillus koreensis]